MSHRLNQIRTALALQRNQLENQIHQVKDALSKKQQAIDTLKAYSIEYKSDFYKTPNHRMPTYQNSQQFFDKLAAVLYTENEALNQLNTRKTALLLEYQGLHQKIEGVQEMLLTHRRMHQQTRDAQEDSLYTELATHHSHPSFKGDAS